MQMYSVTENLDLLDIKDKKSVGPHKASPKLYKAAVLYDSQKTQSFITILKTKLLLSTIIFKHVIRNIEKCEQNK